MKQSPIFSKTYDLLRWLIPVTVKFPREHRFVLATAVQETTMQFQERIIEAARTDDPRPGLRQADTDLTKLRLYLRLCRDLNLLSPGQYGHVARMVSEIGRLLGADERFSELGEFGRIAVNVDTLYREFRGGGERTGTVELFSLMAELAR